MKTDPSLDLGYTIDELARIQDEMAILKSKQKRLKIKAISLMKRLGVKKFHWYEVFATLTTVSKQSFVGGRIAFAEAFGERVARKWFKNYENESIKVVAIKPDPRGGKINKEKTHGSTHSARN